MTDIALILAAGRSVRLGRPKQLVVLDGQPLVVHAVRAAAAAGLTPVVVTGCYADDVAAVVDVETVHATDWSAGLGSSLAAGVRAVADRAASITVLTCDQWAISARDLEALRVPEDHDIVAAYYDGVAGVPARFQPSCFDALSRIEGDVGAQQLIRGGQFRVATVPIDGARFDVDEPDDLEELR